MIPWQPARAPRRCSPGLARISARAALVRWMMSRASLRSSDRWSTERYPILQGANQAVSDGRRIQLVEERADLILARALGAGAFAAYFEAQMRRGRIRRLLYASYMLWARSGMLLAGLDPRGVW
jgi:hypothetical protein